MSLADLQNLGAGALAGALSGSMFVLALFIGFCVLLGFTKTKATAGNTAVIKSLDETISHKAFAYLPPNAPRGHADPLEGLLAKRPS